MISAAARRALEAELGDRIDFDVALAKHTSLRIGGPADALATPATQSELKRTVALAYEHAIELTVLGRGFNTLVSDAGIAGLVLLPIKLRSLERASEDALLADAGVSHGQLTNYCIKHGLAGLEFGAGIPGTLGGWAAMNAGIGDREVKDVIRALQVLAPTGLRSQRIERAALSFEYRALRGLAPGSVITAVELEVEVSTSERVRGEVDRLLAKRAGTQPLDVPSCGSVFKNPPGDFAGRLVEAAGLKGETRGGAQISPLHANFIANLGGATAHDVVSLIEHAQRKVEERFGVRLEAEVRMLGRATPPRSGEPAAPAQQTQPTDRTDSQDRADRKGDAA